MKNAKFILVFILLVAGLSGLFAANALVAFKDATTTTYDLVNPEYQALNGGTSYPAGSGNATNRWRVYAYLSTDGVIDPLGTDGLPTVNDTFLADLNLNFAPGTGHTLNISSAVVPEATWMGAPTWIYLRIFNAITFPAATKYMTFFAPYGPIGAGGVLTVNIMPTYGWDVTPAWKFIVPPPDDTYTYNLTVNGPAGYTVTGPGTYNGAMGTTFTCGPNTTDINDLIGAWDASDPGVDYHWVVDPINVVAGDFAPGTKTAFVKNATITFVREADVHVYNYTLNVAGPAGYHVAGPTGGMEFPAVYVAPDTDMDNELLGIYAPQEAAPAGFHWEPASIDVTAGMFTAQKAAAVQGTRSNSSKAVYNYVANISFSLVPNIIDTDNPPVGVVITPGGDNGLPGTDAGQPAVIVTVAASGIWDVVVHQPAGYPTPWFAYINTSPMLASGPITTLSYTFTGVDFGAKLPLVVTLDDDESLTLPVELSSFTATLTATYFVKLTWVSQSETGLLGYRVYRNTSNDQANAVMITPSMVPATNTSTTQTYSITDNEVSIGNTYWYWLESVDYGTSQFHGPVSVIVEGEVPPVIPTATTMRNAYPNPFKVDGRTTIVVDVKANDAGSVTIYNILGQAVKTYPVIPGTNNITWNGRDSRGNVCGSGIYFYKLSTPSTNQTKKMVIVK